MRSGGDYEGKTRLHNAVAASDHSLRELGEDKINLISLCLLVEFDKNMLSSCKS